MKRNLFCGLLLIVFVGVASIQIADASANNSRVVELYTTSWCPYCRKAETFMKENDIAFVSFDIEKDQAAARRKQQLDSRKGVPLAVIDGQAIYGFSERLYRTALDLED